jgi:hypothetical protein
MFQNHRKTLPISHVHLKTFGHTRENSPEFLRELMARVVPSVLAGGRWRVAEGARLEIALTVCDGVLQISITVAEPTT